MHCGQRGRELCPWLRPLRDRRPREEPTAARDTGGHLEDGRQLNRRNNTFQEKNLYNELHVNFRTTTSIVSFRSSLKTHLFKLAYMRD